MAHLYSFAMCRILYTGTGCLAADDMLMLKPQLARAYACCVVFEDRPCLLHVHLLAHQFFFVEGGKCITGECFRSAGVSELMMASKCADVHLAHESRNIPFCLSLTALFVCGLFFQTKREVARAYVCELDGDYCVDSRPGILIRAVSGLWPMFGTKHLWVEDLVEMSLITKL